MRKNKILTIAIFGIFIVFIQVVTNSEINIKSSVSGCTRRQRQLSDSDTELAEDSVPFYITQNLLDTHHDLKGLFSIIEVRTYLLKQEIDTTDLEEKNISDMIVELDNYWKDIVHKIKKENQITVQEINDTIQKTKEILRDIKTSINKMLEDKVTNRKSNDSKENYNVINETIVDIHNILSDIYNEEFILRKEERNIVTVIRMITGVYEDENFSIDILRSDDKISIDIDDKKISRVFYNLINNAARAMDEERKITILISDLPNEVRILVSDTGEGMSEKKVIAFNEGEEIGTTKSKGLNHGRGLSIVRKIIEAHGGEISVESRKQEGTTFIINLPKD